MITIDWLHFTPWLSLAGGVLIGTGAVLLILLNGRIAGISGILGGLLFRHQGSDKYWRLAFILGLVLAPLIWRFWRELPPIEVNTSLPVIVLAGLLVGFGTRLGSGCTSGHGVCGLSRFSPRSFVATLTFMAVGFLMVFFVRHLLGGY